MFGYACTLQTDTEVITYIFDYLVRKQGLTLREAASAVSYAHLFVVWILQVKPAGRVD